MARRHNEDGEKVIYGDYFDWLAKRRCFACGTFPSTPHHVKSVGSGGEDASNLVNVCYQCHTDIEQKGRHTWQDRTGHDLQEQAARMWSRYQQWRQWNEGSVE